MSTDLGDYAGTLRRQITPLGTTLFAGTTDNELAQHLTDAFWEAKLDGFLTGYVADEDGVVAPYGGAELPVENIALIALYAAVKILRNKILNTPTNFRAQAGPVEFEQANSATVLAELLKQLAATKNRIITEAQYGSTDVVLIDAYSARLFHPDFYYGDIMLGG